MSTAHQAREPTPGTRRQRWAGYPVLHPRSWFSRKTARDDAMAGLVLGVFHPDGRVEHVDPPDDVPPGEVVVLQPYGSIFFATAQALRDQLPNVTPTSRNSVFVLRIRGVDDAGSTVTDMLGSYARSLIEVDSRLAIVTGSDRVERQLRQTGTARLIGADRVYRSSGCSPTVAPDATSWTVPAPPSTIVETTTPDGPVSTLRAGAAHRLTGSMRRPQRHQDGPV